MAKVINQIKYDGIEYALAHLSGGYTTSMATVYSSPVVSEAGRVYVLPINSQVAVITGASSGLGWQIAQAYASQGAKLALFARREERLLENVAEIEKEFGTEVMYAVCDVGDYDSITAAVDKVMDAYGRIDILVNAAGMGNNKMVVDQSNEK